MLTDSLVLQFPVQQNNFRASVCSGQNLLAKLIHWAIFPDKEWEVHLMIECESIVTNVLLGRILSQLKQFITHIQVSSCWLLGVRELIKWEEPYIAPLVCRCHLPDIHSLLSTDRRASPCRQDGPPLGAVCVLLLSTRQTISGESPEFMEFSYFFLIFACVSCW